jgi:hypothetical protein
MSSSNKETVIANLESEARRRLRSGEGHVLIRPFFQHQRLVNDSYHFGIQKSRNLSHGLKGLSSENYEGSKMVSIERSCFKHVVLGIYFIFFSVSIL